MSTYPSTAIPFPPAPSGGFPEYRANVIGAIKEQVAAQNSVAKSNFAQACDNWTQANSRNRDMGLPLSPKPTVPLGQVVKTWSDPEAVVDNVVIWVWIEDDAPLCPPCPDLPALPPTPPANNPDIGVHVYGAFYQCLKDDTTADGSQLKIPFDIPGGVPAGTYVKISNPFGSVYKKIA